MKLEQLSEKEYWEKIYARWGRTRTIDWKSKLLLGQGKAYPWLNYSDFVFWKKLLPRFLPRIEGRRAIEVGCAPGFNLVKLRNFFGCEPFGVEYSDRGVEIARDVFTKFGLNSSNVIHTDFFSREFLNEHKGKYDLVISLGFIEHFTDPSGAVKAHVDLLAPDGYLVVLVPNLTGINKMLAGFFDPSVLSLHNLEIMKINAFRGLFDIDGLTPVFCDYSGGFNLGLFVARAPLKRAFLLLCKVVQLFINAVMLIFADKRRFEHHLFSSHLVFIGKK